MTEFEWNPEGNKGPISVIEILINDTVYHMDIEKYNMNVSEGKTKFVTKGETLIMITPEQYELLSEFNHQLNFRGILGVKENVEEDLMNLLNGSIKKN
jgi:hypothetical protein